LNSDTDIIIRDLFARARSDEGCAAVAACLEDAWKAGGWEPDRITACLRGRGDETSSERDGSGDAADGKGSDATS
jgi:hypothetical protein